MLVQRLESLERIAEHRARWNELADGIPFRQWEWLATWWAHYHDQGELYLLQVLNPEGKLVGIAPWMIRHQAFSGRTIQSLGSGNACSEYQGVLVDPNCRPAVLAALAQWLVEANHEDREHRWNRLFLDAVDSNDVVVRDLLNALIQRGCSVHCQPGARCWRIPIPSTWDEYLRGLPKPQRKRMRQARESLHASGEFRLSVVDDFDHWQSAWKQFGDLHQRRRTSLGQPGCFADPIFAHFLRSASDEFLHQKQARLVLVEKDEETLAALLTFGGGSVSGAVSYGYQMGTNPDFLNCSPGWLVVCAALQVGLEHQESALDLLRGDESYKGRMGGVPHSVLQVRVVPAQFSSQLRHTAWLTSTALKSWIKTGLNATRNSASECTSL